MSEMSTATPRGRLEQIWIKHAHRESMDSTPKAALVPGIGIVGNADQGGRRQVTLISRERWADASKNLGAEVDPSARRANFLVSGITLENTPGRILRVGDCRLRILGETRPCGRMDEAFPGLRDALDARWGGGAFAEVLDRGSVSVGDVVGWEENEVAG